jgi:transcriptional regulator with XRE-family HTH domain
MLSDNIKRLRKEKTWSREQLARKADITFSTVAKLESGVNTNPTLKVLQQVARALGVGIDDLVKE